MNISVTGVNGFVGKHLARELKRRGYRVIGLGREPAPAVEIKASLDDYWVCDLLDTTALSKLKFNKIDKIINLAGLAKVGDSFSNEDQYLKVNVGVLANLCQLLVDRSFRPRIIAVSSSAVYDPNQPMPLTEESKTTGENSPYAKSKHLMEEVAERYRKLGLDIVTVRPFNHTGPGQEPGFLIPDLHKNIMTANSSGAPLKTGNLATRREYTDVRDVVEAYVQLATKPRLKHNLYNICRGESVAGRTILELLIRHLNLPDIKVTTDPALLRPNDIPDLFGSYDRLHTETGWQPKISIKKTIKDFIESA